MHTDKIAQLPEDGVAPLFDDQILDVELRACGNS
jgi:hypothetical protein